MLSAQLLEDAFGRISDLVLKAVDGLDEERLAYRIDADANSIGWLRILGNEIRKSASRHERAIVY